LHDTSRLTHGFTTKSNFFYSVGRNRHHSVKLHSQHYVTEVYHRNKWSNKNVFR